MFAGAKCTFSVNAEVFEIDPEFLGAFNTRCVQSHLIPYHSSSADAMFVAGGLKAIGPTNRQLLRARIDSWRKLLDDADAYADGGGARCSA